MNTSYSSLVEHAVHFEDVQLIDTTIRIQSSSEQLATFVIDEIVPLLPLDTPVCTNSSNCVVEHLSSVNETFPSLLEDITCDTGKQIRSVELGSAVVYSKENERVIEVENIGLLYHDGAGNFLILIEKDSLFFSDGKRLNLQALLNILIGEVLLLANKFLVHAGCVGKNGICQLWTGDSGAGKTTQTLKLTASGYSFYGDDQIIIGRVDNYWWAWPFWRSIKVTGKTFELFADLLPPLEGDFVGNEKRVIDNVEQTLGVQKPKSARITGIYLLVPHQQNVCQQLTLAEAFGRIAPSFLHALQPGTMVDSMETLMDLFEEVPVYVVSWDKAETIDSL